MKKALLLTVAVCAIAVAHGQISHENTYSHTGSLQVYDLDDDGYKYVLFDTLTKHVRFYSMDHTLWKSVSVGVPSSAKLAALQWVSKKLFNADDKIEFILGYYQITQGIVEYTTALYNENGTSLHSFGADHYTTLYNINGKYKLVTHNVNYSQTVYGLPGTYDNGSTVGMKGAANPQPTPDLYPNPMQSAARLSYSLPDGVHSGQVKIYNAAGVLVRQMPVGKAFDHVIITRDDLPAGIYLYEVTGAGYRSEGGRFVIM